MPRNGLRSIANPFLFALLIAVACVEGRTYWTKADAKAQPVEVRRVQNPPPYLFRTWPDTPDINECSIGGGDPQLYLASVVVCAPRRKPLVAPITQVPHEPTTDLLIRTKTKTEIVKPTSEEVNPPVKEIKRLPAKTTPKRIDPAPVRRYIERKQPREPPPKKKSKRDKGCGWQWC